VSAEGNDKTRNSNAFYLNEEERVRRLCDMYSTRTRYHLLALPVSMISFLVSSSLTSNRDRHQTKRPCVMTVVMLYLSGEHLGTPAKHWLSQQVSNLTSSFVGCQSFAVLKGIRKSTYLVLIHHICRSGLKINIEGVMPSSPSRGGSQASLSLIMRTPTTTHVGQTSRP